MRKFNAVFQGGGVKGIGLVGALTRVEEEGDIEFTGLAGTSAGSIVAALYAAGYTTKELYQVLKDTNFSDLLDPAPVSILHLWRRYGVHRGQKLYKWIYTLLEKKGIVEFKDVPRENLKVIASDVSEKSILVFDKNSHPRVKVAEAIRMSISIPFFFEAYRFGQSLVVDGGLLTNYPLWVFADSKYPTLGFKLVSRRTTVPQAPRSFPQYLTSLVTTMLEAHDKEDEKTIDYAQTIHIPTHDVATTDFSLDDQKKELLYQSGYLAASNYIRKENILKRGPIPQGNAPRPGYILPESLERLRAIPEEFVEKSFRANEFHETVFIDRPNAEVEVRESLINESVDAQNEIVRRIAADAPIDAKDLNFTAWFDTGNGEQKAATKIEESPDRREFKLHIGFKGQPIKPGQSVQVRRKYRAPGAVSLNEDYWAIPVNFYHKPLNSLLLEVDFRMDPSDHGFFAVADTGLQPIDISGPVSLTVENVTRFRYTAKVPMPKSLYLVRWRIE